MSRRLGLFVVAGASASTLQRNVFGKVVEKLHDVLTNAEESHINNENLFKKEECSLKDEIKGYKAAIPVNKEIIEEATANMNAMASSSEKLSVEAENLDREIKNLEDEKTRKTNDRNDEHQAYLDEKTSLSDAVEKLGRAIVQVQGKTDSETLLQVSEGLRHLSKTKHNGQIALLQTTAKMGSSGQVIGILKQLKDTFVADLELGQSEEDKALFYFNEFVKRTDASLKSNRAASKAKKKQVKQNTGSWNKSSKAKKQNEREFSENTENLGTAEENLASHREYFKQLSAENANLVATLKEAILLLTSKDANSIGNNAQWSGFTQLSQKPRTSLLSKIVKKDDALASEDANTYGWDLISNAVKDIKDSVAADKQALEDRYYLCENQLKHHHKTYKDLKLGEAEKTQILETAEINIGNLETSIKTDKASVTTKTEENKTTANLIRAKEEEVVKEVSEAEEADVMFNKAIEVLSKFEKGTVTAEKAEAGTAEGAYQSNQNENSNVDTIVGIIKHAQQELKTEIEDTKRDSQKQMDDWRAANAKRATEIQELKDAIATALQDLGNEKAVASGAKTYLSNNAEALGLEAEWWGPAPGHKSQTDGESCIEFLGRHDLQGLNRHENEFKATKVEDGTQGGLYHSKIQETTAEHSALEALEAKIEQIRSAYVGKSKFIENL